jgi:hypothetical protein
LRDRDHGLAAELVVGVEEVGGAGGVDRDRVERQLERVDRAQPGLDQDHDRGPGGQVGQPREVARGLDLAHHVLVDEARQAPRRAARDLAAEVGRVAGRPGRPLVPADVVEEGPQVPQQPALLAVVSSRACTCARSRSSSPRVSSRGAAGSASSAASQRQNDRNALVVPAATAGLLRRHVLTG